MLYPLTAEKWLRRLLLVIGLTSVAALPAAIMPQSWLASAVAWLEPGTPVKALVTYLARLLSFFYFLFGMLMICYARDLTRYLPLIRITAAWCLVGLPAVIVFGWPMRRAGIAVGLLADWVVFDAAFGFVFGLVVLHFTRSLPSDSPQRRSP